MPKTVKLTEAELPKCVICAEKHGKRITAKALSLVTSSYGVVGTEYESWELTCTKCSENYLHYNLVEAK